MITAIPLMAYGELLSHYISKWQGDKVERKYKSWEEDQKMRKDLGYDDKNFKVIPKRRIRSNAARKKHGY